MQGSRLVTPEIYNTKLTLALIFFTSLCPLKIIIQFNLCSQPEFKAPLPPPREDSIQARATHPPSSSHAAVASSESGSNPGSSGGAGLMLIRIAEAQNLVIPSHLSSLQPSDELHGKSQPYCVIELDKNEVIANAKDWNLSKKTMSWNHRTSL